MELGGLGATGFPMMDDGPEHGPEHEQPDQTADIEDGHVQVIDPLTDSGSPARHVECYFAGGNTAASETYQPCAMVNCIFSHMALPVHARKDGEH
ncbi:hypothetical protein D3C76_1338500 [compost metagenome]